MENLETKELASVLEGILFASGEPVDALPLRWNWTERPRSSCCSIWRIITPMSGAECG